MLCNYTFNGFIPKMYVTVISFIIFSSSEIYILDELSLGARSCFMSL